MNNNISLGLDIFMLFLVFSDFNIGINSNISSILMIIISSFHNCNIFLWSNILLRDISATRLRIRVYVYSDTHIAIFANWFNLILSLSILNIICVIASRVRFFIFLPLSSSVHCCCSFVVFFTHNILILTFFADFERHICLKFRLSLVNSFKLILKFNFSDFVLFFFFFLILDFLISLIFYILLMSFFSLIFAFTNNFHFSFSVFENFTVIFLDFFLWS